MTNRVGKHAAFDTEDKLVEYVNEWVDPHKLMAFVSLRDWVDGAVSRVRAWHDSPYSGHALPFKYCGAEPCSVFVDGSSPVFDLDD